MTWRQSAGVRSMSTLEASQRLHAGDLSYAFLVGAPQDPPRDLDGLFEGDGYFYIGCSPSECNQKGKYLSYELGIELSNPSPSYL